MPAYWYTTSEDATGPRNVIHAESLPAALLELGERGENVGAAGIDETPMPIRTQPVAETDLLNAYRQLGALISGGTDLVTALRHLAVDCPNPRLRVALFAVACSVEEGAPLWEALDQHPRTFRPEVVAVVRAAESTGELSRALDGLAAQSDTLSRIARRASVPLVYPLFICLVAAGVILFFFTFIAPKMLSLYAELGVRKDYLPYPTLLMGWLASRLPGLLAILMLIAVVFVIVYLVMKRTASGRMELDYWRMKLPIFGQLSFSAATARMCATLGILVEHRVPASVALRLAGNASGSEVLASGMRRAQEHVENGGTIAEALRESHALPPSLLWRLTAGEESGTLPETAGVIGGLYLDNAEFLARRAIAIIEPVSVILVGSVVGFSLLGMFLPLISILSSLSQ